VRSKRRAKQGRADQKERPSGPSGSGRTAAGAHAEAGKACGRQEASPAQRTGDLWLYLGPNAKIDHRSMQIDSLALALVTAGILLAVAVAILVGTATARLFFDASRGEVEDVVDRTHEVSP
jgi:hypothetical protein